MKDHHLNETSFIKTILMLIVILGHAMAFWTGDWFTSNPIIKSQGLNVLYIWLNSFDIYAFALVSGYIFSFKIRGGGVQRI